MEPTKEENYIPDIITDANKGVSFRKGRFYGKGGFAKCYEITDIRTGNIFAGKIISKKLMKSSSQREKITQEIQIHRSLDNKHVVGFYGHFEDTYNIYIVLELCQSRSMMELHKRRKALTEPEVRYFMQQIVLGVNYLHQHRIIHRDLKLGNLLLNENLDVKIADFGLAAKIEYDGERKKTVCGTPNYIAPEIISKSGHSYEVDVWSIGCIMYTLLVGKPPFETASLKETYSRIKRCDYNLPVRSKISKSAVSLIKHMLQQDPKCRPKVSDILKSEFFTDGYLPKQLPATCLTTAPRFEGKLLTRKPLLEVNAAGDAPSSNTAQKPPVQNPAIGYKNYVKQLVEQLGTLLKTSPGSKLESKSIDELTDPASRPVVWISKWVDYSDKYGFGYQLSDDGVWVMFNDYSRLGVHANKKNVYYILENGDELYYNMSDHPQSLAKKVKLLHYFERYMHTNLMKAGAAVPVRECDAMSRVPYLCQWFRSSNAVVMILSNGTVQLNFTDHTKIILCPLMAAVTYIDKAQSFLTFKFSSIEEHGCCKPLAQNLKFAHDKLRNLLAN